MHGPKTVPGVQQIMRTAKQADVPRVGCAKPCKRLDVIEFEQRLSLTAPAFCRNIRTLTAVSTVSISTHRYWQVPVAFANRHRAGFGC
jgi:hypothetical protein